MWIAVLHCAQSFSHKRVFETPWTVVCQTPQSNGDSLGKNTRVGCHALFQGILTYPGIEPKSPTLQADSLPSESPGKPKNMGVGDLFLLQGEFQTQELNQGLLNYRQIHYQLSYPGSPTRIASKTRLGVDCGSDPNSLLQNSVLNRSRENHQTIQVGPKSNPIKLYSGSDK